MSSDTCLSSFGARLFVLTPPVPLVCRFPSLCCTESEDSIDGEFNSENKLQLRLCAFYFIQPSVKFFSHLESFNVNAWTRAQSTTDRDLERVSTW